MGFMNNFKKLNFDLVLNGLNKNQQNKNTKSSDEEEEYANAGKNKALEEKKKLDISVESLSEYSGHNSIYELNDGGEYFKQSLTED